MKRILILLILIIIMQPSFAAGSKSYSDDLPTAGRQRSPVALTNLFTDILSWINGVYAGTGDASSANQALISLGNGTLSYTNVIRSNVDLEHTGGNGTTGQALVSNGDGTTEWASVGTLTDGDKTDITVASSGTVWTIDNGAVDTDALAANAVTSAKITNGTIATADIANGAVTTEKITNGEVTYAKIQNVTDARLLGNATGGAAAPSEISVDSTLTLASSTLSLTKPLKTTSIAADASTTSTTYTDITGLSFTPSADTNYVITVLIPYDQSSDRTDFQVVIPTNTTVNLAGVIERETSSIAWVTTSTSTVSKQGPTSASGGLMCRLNIILAVGSSPSGTFKIQYKTSNALTQTTVKKGSTLVYKEL